MMAVWTDVTTGFDTEDETVNFGTRAVSNDSNGVFETLTLATIQPCGEVVKNPSVIAASCFGGSVCIAIDRSLIVFSDDACSGVHFTYTFDSSIDCFVLSDDGLFIIVGVGNALLCLHRSVKGQLLFSRSALPFVNNIDVVYIKIFLHAIGNNVYDIFMIGSSGQIFRIPKVNFETLLQAVEKGNDELLKEVTDVITVEIVRPECSKSQLSSAALLTDSESTRLILVGDEITVLSVGSTVSETWMPEESLRRLKTIKAVEHASLLIGLTEDGKLLVICSHTFLCLSLWDEIPVKDFILLEGIFAEKETCILFLTQPTDSGKCILQLASFPGLDVKFQFYVSSVTFLMPLMSTAQELLFLEGFGSPHSQFILSVHVRGIVESAPEDRFYRLLRWHRFDEAEAFAHRFKLDIELVHKEHVKHYMELLQPWSLCCDSSEDVTLFNNLLCLLNKIEDLEFVCEACIKTHTTDLNKMQALLDYARERLKKIDVKNLNTARISYLESQIWNTSLRFDTFLLLSQSDVEDLQWYEFCGADLLCVCKQHLQRGQLSQASLVWARHWRSFKTMLSEATVTTLLNVIPVGLEMSNLISWLHHFVPSVLQATPQSLKHVVSWAIKSIKSLEVERAKWPKSGLDYVEQLLETIKQVGDSCLDVCHLQHFVTNTHCEELVIMANSLRELRQLKENHNISVALADFMQSNKNEVVNILLRKVAPTDVKPLVTHFLTNFMLDNGLVPDTILSDYILDILSHSADWWCYYAGALWEDTFAAIIPCISNPEVRVKCIISVLKMAPVPWSSTVAGIAKQGLEFDHPLTGLVRHEQKIMEVKIVQKKYGLVKFLIEKCSLYDLIHQIWLIFKQGNESMLQDALTYASVNTKLLKETYIICVEHYVETGKQYQALELLDSLKPELIVECCQRIVYKAQSYLKSSLHDKVRTLYMEVLSSLSPRLEKVAGNMGDKFPIDIPLQEVRNMHLLHLEFGKRMSAKDYFSVLSCSKILSECIGNLLTTTGDPFEIYCKVGKLSRLLQLPLEEGILEMIRQAIQTENLLLICNVIRNLLHFDSLPTSANQKLLVMVYHFLQTSCTASTVGAALHLAYRIASYSCTHCSLDVLSSWLELFHWICTAQYLTACEEESDVFKVMTSQAQNMLMSWNFTPLYKDPTIFSNSNQILLFLKELFFYSLCHASGQLDMSHINLQLEGLAKQLQEQQHDLGSVMLWCSLNVWALSVSYHTQAFTLLSEITSITEHSIHVLLCKVVTARQLDVELGLALLFCLGIDVANNWLLRSLETFKQDLRKVSFVAQLGVLFCKHCKLDSKYFLFINTKCTWAKRLAAYGISSNELLNTTSSQHTHVLQSLMKLKQVDISLVLEYCHDFELDCQECLLLHLKTILMTWQPEFEVEETIDGEEVLNVLDTVTEVAKKCEDVIAKIENKGCLVQQLDLILKSLNYYNYEMYIYVINLLEQLTPSHNFIRKKVLLMFLRDYRRVQGPRREELDDWLLHFPQSPTLPRISHWRLPFLPFMGSKPLHLLQSELNLKTYKQWIELSAVLGIETNHICSVTIQETLRFRATTDKWNVHSQDVLFVDQIQECVSNISNLEIASACMYFVMNHMAPGADQVAAAKLCYTYTQKWYKDGEDASAKERLNSVKFKYFCLATTNVLYQYDLGKADYLQLVSKPSELMLTLYEDPSIVARGKGHIAHYPDINGAVEALASLHGHNYIKFCLNQLKTWLQPKSLQSDLPENTCDLRRLLQNHREVNETDDNFYRILNIDENAERTIQKSCPAIFPGLLDLINCVYEVRRACYILKSGEGSTLRDCVLKLAFQLDPDDTCSVAVQLRALQCLMAVFSTNTLEEVTGINIDDIRRMLNSLQYVTELEMLGYSCSLPSFESCNKLELVMGVWRSQNNNPQALIVIARLCVDFGIQQHSIWKSVLKQMTKYSMVCELEVLLLHLADLGHIQSSKEYMDAWELVLFTPFLKGEQVDACIHSLKLLQSCPVLCRINLNIIIEHSLQLHWPHFAAVVLPLLGKDAFQQQKQMILKSEDAEKLIQNLQKLSIKGVFIAETAIQLLKSDAALLQ